MQHIVEFGVTIDDDAIKKNIEANILDAVAEKIANNIAADLPRKFTNAGETPDWERLAKKCIGEFLEEHKEEVIKSAVSSLVMSISRTKAFKERWLAAQDEIEL